MVSIDAKYFGLMGKGESLWPAKRAVEEWFNAGSFGRFMIKMVMSRLSRRLSVAQVMPCGPFETVGS